MKLVAPSYYPAFRCIAGRCRHSCCVGWEIDVDEDSLRRYRRVQGAMGERLRAAIEEDESGAHFRLDEQERCPFLNEEGLCDMILCLGEDSLCQICADHPRFRSFFSGRTEIGLGLCCEAAAELILSWPEKVSLITLKDDGTEEPLLPQEAAVLALRERLLTVVQDRSLPITERIARLEAVSLPLPEEDLPRWAEMLLSLEHLDDAWPRLLTALREAKHPCTEISAELVIHFEQLLVYLLYRHIPGAVEDGDVPGRVGMCALGVKVIAALLHLGGDLSPAALAELARLWSSEIEYSDENVGALLDALDEGGPL